MKKIFALFIAVLVLTFSFAIVPTKANAEEVPETSSNEAVETPVTPEDSSVEEIPTEEPSETPTETPTEEPTEEPAPEVTEEPKDETITLTKEELTNIINSVLNEQQKELASNLAETIASKFNLDENIVYLVCAGLLAILLVIIVLVSKVVRSKGSLKAINSQLTAQQSAYAVLNQTKEDLTEVLKNLSVEDITKIVNTAYTSQATELIEKVSAQVVKKLKIDDKTLAELLGNEKTLVTQVKTLTEALLAIATNNRDLAVNILSKTPTIEEVNALALENEKLKVALGEDAVAKILNATTEETEEEPKGV